MTNGEKFKATFGFGADGSRVIAVNETWWDCEFQNSKPITKANCIRSMTDEALANFLYATWKEQDEFSKEVCKRCGDTDIGCQPNCWLNWLREEAEE